MESQSINSWNILKHSNIGFEFEFYTILDRTQLKKRLEKLFKINIVNIKNLKGGYRLVRDLSGGKGMFEFITPPMPYLESLYLLSEMLKFIRVNGYTTNKSAIQFSFSFDKSKIQVSNLNVLKCMLAFDEDYIYKKFNSRKYSVYAKSIKVFKPVNDLVNLNSVLDNNFITPNSKYHGINFNHIKQNYLEVRYCGGSNYEEKYDDIKDIMEMSITSIYNMMLAPALTELESTLLKDILCKLSDKIESIKNYDIFLQHYKNKINLTIDLADNYDILKYRFSSIRGHIFNLVVLNDIKTCNVNLDTTRMRMQISNLSNINNVTLDDFEIFDSKLVGMFTNCSFFNCDINYSNFDKCNIVDENNVKNSKISSCNIGHTNSIYQSFIKSNSSQLISGHYKKSIITGGNVSKFLTADKETEILGDSYTKYQLGVKDKK